MHAYIHVPFCGRRCSYCDFAIAVRSRTPDAEFVTAVRAEWQRRRDHPSIVAAATLDTIYFGGGTPSRLDPEAIAELIGLLTEWRSLAPGAEVTIEANPDDVTPERAAGWRAAGVNRISLGVQSHDPAVLAWMHRTHRVEQVAPAVDALRVAGIDNFSLDLIFALPEALRRDWERDLELSLALEPSHLSLYGLTVEPHTPLGHWTARGAAREAPDERYAAEYLAAHARLRGAGFEHYEVSNAARPGHRAEHNAAYWAGRDYLGLGPSAHSFLSGVRSWNEREWVAYARRAAEGPVEAGREALDPAQRRLEEWYLGLRTDHGVAAADVPQLLTRQWQEAGWAVEEGTRIRLTPEGWLRLDALVTVAAGS